jgi:hypothetical protein
VVSRWNCRVLGRTSRGGLYRIYSALFCAEVRHLTAECGFMFSARYGGTENYRNGDDDDIESQDNSSEKASLLSSPATSPLIPILSSPHLNRRTITSQASDLLSYSQAPARPTSLSTTDNQASSDNQPLLNSKDLKVTASTGSFNRVSARRGVREEETQSFTIEMQETAAIGADSNENNRRSAVSAQGIPRQGFLDWILGKKVPSCARTFNIGTADEIRRQFPPNIIRNQKYHTSTFVFVVLYNQVRTRVRRLADCYIYCVVQILFQSLLFNHLLVAICAILAGHVRVY